jgi:4-hydroxy-3-methylbut-2-en-1-yl diphosphate reductase
MPHSNMKIEVDPKSGFCFGVDLAVKKAEEEILKSGKVYCLGEIVHNDMEVKRLEEIGMITIDHEQFKILKNATVLIRAHGEPPETYQIAKKNGIYLIDASCPIVLKFQKRVVKAKDEDYQVVIYGKKEHPEIIGLSGQINFNAIVIETEEDLDKLDLNRAIALFSQTTKPGNSYRKIAEKLKHKMSQIQNTPLLKVHHTICGQVSGRDENLIAFSKKNDVVVFVGGKNSSNAKTLYMLCKSVNERTHFITSTDEIHAEWFNISDSVGICGATSTPKWLIDKAKDYILDVFGIQQ